jgi:hypothetical protein
MTSSGREVGEKRGRELSGIYEFVSERGRERGEDVNRRIAWWTNKTTAKSVGLVIVETRITGLTTIVAGGITIVVKLDESDNIGGGRFVRVSLMEAINEL